MTARWEEQARIRESRFEGYGPELKETDCKFEMLNYVDSLVYEERLRKPVAERIKHRIRGFNGTTLFTLYLYWMEDYERQADVARALRVSQQRISAVLNDELGALRGDLILATGEDGHPLELDPWVFARDVVYDDPEDGDTVMSSQSDKKGSVVGIRRYDRDASERVYAGETNERMDYGRKSPDDIAAEAIREFRRERREEERLRARIAEKIEESLRN